MVNVVSTDLAMAPPSGRVAFASASEIYKAFKAFLQRQRIVILTSTGILLLLGLVYIVLAPPGFVAQSTILLENRKLSPSQVQSLLGETSIDSSAVDSQVEAIRSDKVALAVIRKLHLVQDPEFSEPSRDPISLVRGFVSALLPKRNIPFDGTQETLEELKVLDRFSDNLSVTRVNLTYVIRVAFRASTPQKAALIADAVANAYIADHLDARSEAQRNATNWLKDRLDELRRQAGEAEQIANDFRRVNNIIASGVPGRLISDQQLVEASTQLGVARVQTSEAKARFERIQKIVEEDLPDANVGEATQNEVIVKLRQQLNDLKSREKEISDRYGHDHQAAVLLRNQATDARRALFDELKRTAETFRSDYEIARTRQANLERNFSDLVATSQTASQAQVKLRELESSAQSARSLYDTFLQRYMEGLQQESFPSADARVLSDAIPPTSKTYPQTRVILPLCLLGGLLLGAGIGYLRELGDDKLCSLGAVRSLLAVNGISMLPVIGNPSPKERNRNQQTSQGEVGSNLSKKQSMTTAVDYPSSSFSEGIRAIRNFLDRSRSVGDEGKVIGFTSLENGEGKTIVTTNLAFYLSSIGFSVLVIDGNLERPALSANFASEGQLGIRDIVERRLEPSDAVSHDKRGPSFLFCGSNTGNHSSDAALDSRPVQEAVSKMRPMYDYILVDLPSINSSFCVWPALSLIDDYVVVAECGETSAEVLSEAIEGLPGAREKIIGVVVNKATSRAAA